MAILTNYSNNVYPND